MATNPGKRRMDTDVLKLIQSKHKVKILSGINEFIVKFVGPADTPYQGGLWNIRVELPERYPYKSPSIGFMNRIFHPNIDEPSGSVCLDVINQTWTPLYDLKNIFDVFLPQLLSYPNPSDPLNGEAATMYLHNKDLYIKRVKESVKKYASPEVLSKQAMLNGESSSEDESSDSDDEEVKESSSKRHKGCASSADSKAASTSSHATRERTGSSLTQSSASSSADNNNQSTSALNIAPTSTLRKSPEQNSNDSAVPASSFQSQSSQRNVAESRTGGVPHEEDENLDSHDESEDMFESQGDCSDLSDNELEMDF